jgi:hypothetical protein
MLPLDILPTLLEAMNTHGPRYVLIARDVATLVPEGPTRAAYQIALEEEIRRLMWPEPGDLTSQARLAVVAWHCLPLDLRD